MIHEIVTFIGRNAIWAGPIMFAVAFGESLAFVSLLFPGTAIMIAAGAFIPGGTLSPWPLLIGCIAGATTGDAVSYWLGRRYGHLVERVWPFTRHPELMARGYAFFKRHGGKSVFIGRFFGPLRAVIPLVAGITKMPTARFWITNVTSAFVWAPALLLPGVLTALFVQTLHVAKDVKWLLLTALVALILGATWAVKKYRIFGGRSEL
jgi:membrane protein DedA with SNARE-associated domain